MKTGGKIRKLCSVKYDPGHGAPYLNGCSCSFPALERYPFSWILDGKTPPYFYENIVLTAIITPFF